MISASSEELDFDEIEEFQKEIVDDESFIEEICNLFRPNDKEVNSVEEADVFSPIQIKDIPQHLRAIIEDWDLPGLKTEHLVSQKKQSWRS